MSKIICAECGLEFHGRSDKKFCSDQCRSSFNNRKNSDSNNTMKNINNALRKNRRILNDFLETDKNRVKKEILVNKGFNFKYSTHSFTTTTGKHYQFWYDCGLMQMDNGSFYIVRDFKE